MAKNTFQRHVDLLLIGEESKKHYVLIKDFNTFKFHHTLYRRRNYFCCYCLQAFSIAETLKDHVNDYFKINGKKIIKIPKRCIC